MKMVLEITFDTADVENAYLVAKDAVLSIEAWEAVEHVKVLRGVADDELRSRRTWQIYVCPECERTSWGTHCGHHPDPVTGNRHGGPKLKPVTVEEKLDKTHPYIERT